MISPVTKSKILHTYATSAVGDALFLTPSYSIFVPVIINLVVIGRDGSIGAEMGVSPTSFCSQMAGKSFLDFILVNYKKILSESIRHNLRKISAKSIVSESVLNRRKINGPNVYI
jgi:hypothetical protein